MSQTYRIGGPLGGNRLVLTERYVELIGFAGSFKVERARVEQVLLEPTGHGPISFSLVGQGEVLASVRLTAAWAPGARDWLVRRLGQEPEAPASPERAPWYRLNLDGMLSSLFALATPTPVPSPSVFLSPQVRTERLQAYRSWRSAFDGLTVRLRATALEPGALEELRAEAAALNAPRNLDPESRRLLERAWAELAQALALVEGPDRGELVARAIASADAAGDRLGPNPD